MCIYNTDQTSLIGGLVSIRCLFTQTGYIGIVQTITQTRGVTCSPMIKRECSTGAFFEAIRYQPGLHSMSSTG